MLALEVLGVRDEQGREPLRVFGESDAQIPRPLEQDVEGARHAVEGLAGAVELDAGPVGPGLYDLGQVRERGAAGQGTASVS